MASPSIHAMKDGDVYATEFASTTAGLQAAIDYLAGGKGKVFIGPGTLEITTVISLHSGCHLQGAGIGATVINRSTGSLVTGDAQFSGNTLIATAYGSNGTMPTSVSDAQTDITVTDITLDGNQSNFGSVNPATPGHMGIWFRWVSGIVIRNVAIKDFLMTAIQLDSCLKAIISGCRILRAGQYASASSRNGINFINNQNGIGSGYGMECVISDCVIDTVSDTHIDFSDCRNAVAQNVVMYGGKYAFELEGTTTNSTTMKNFTVTNCTIRDNTGEFFRVGISDGVALQNVRVSNCTMEGDASAHNRGAILLPDDSDVACSSIGFENCTFRNINSSDTASIAFVRLDQTATSTAYDISFINCDFYGGAASSTKTNCRGFDITGDVRRVRIVGCGIYDAAGIGINLVPSGARVARDILVRDCVVQDCTSNGLRAFVDNGAGTLSNVLVAGCTFRDTNEQTGTRVIDIGTSVASATASAITVSGCRVIRTGANPMTNAVRIFQDVATTDDISILDNDLSGVSAAHIATSGTPTNIHFRCRPGKGSDITSAATIAIPLDGDVFHVTGSTNVTNGITVNKWDAGRVITLIFDSTPTVSDTGTSKLSADLVATADDTLTLRCDGTNWYEVSRSAN